MVRNRQQLLQQQQQRLFQPPGRLRWRCHAYDRTRRAGTRERDRNPGKSHHQFDHARVARRSRESVARHQDREYLQQRVSNKLERTEEPSGDRRKHQHSIQCCVDVTHWSEQPDHSGRLFPTLRKRQPYQRNRTEQALVHRNLPIDLRESRVGKSPGDVCPHFRGYLLRRERQRSASKYRRVERATNDRYVFQYSKQRGTSGYRWPWKPAVNWHNPHH